MTAVPVPVMLRLLIMGTVILLGSGAYFCEDYLGLRGRAAIGILCFVLMAVAASTDPRRINWRTVIAGIILQFLLAALILRSETVYGGFQVVGGAIQKFLDFTDEGAKFVFGSLADPAPPPSTAIAGVLGGPSVSIVEARIPARPFLFAFKALPAVIFVSSFFSVLYAIGLLQFIVKVFARIMVWIMGTSGAETLSAVANVFMGQTEAPLIVKPYILGMTRSELNALMVGGMATISGGVMVAYIGMGADPVAILATSVMAAPCGLYLAKILVPETETPVTLGSVALAEPEATEPRDWIVTRVISAAAEGASDGMKLVLNIAAMLIAFIAFIALINHVLGKIDSALGLEWGMTLQAGFAKLFAPVAFLMGVPLPDVPKVGELLGTKLVLNEFVAYTVLTGQFVDMDPRSKLLAVFALTGFANFASIGIQLGGIGSLPRDSADQQSLRSRLARLGPRALLAGFLATVLNASVAGLLL